MVAWEVLAAVLAVAVIASLVSIRIGVSVALLEMIGGVLAGNYFGVSTNGQDWLPFIAGIASVVLVFLAGAEIDPVAMRKTWKASAAIGILSFLAPFLAAWGFAALVLHWSPQASLLAGVALSTTSVAVVYVVLVESGTSRTATGKLILSACFITDLGTALALSVLFLRPNEYIFLLIAAIAASAWLAPKIFAPLLRYLKGKVGETEVKVIFFSVILLGAVAQLAGSQAVLPAYIFGLAMASVMAQNRAVLLRLRSMTLAFLTPFFFINAGLDVSLAAVVVGVGLVVILFGVKVGAKLAGVLPTTRRLVGHDSVYISLLMSTGLTFGTISALYGLESGIIDKFQFSVLLTVVIASAIIPTLIAQQWFRPAPEAGDQ
ncbi:MAG TPA: cation:proton antiporter [Thermoplasmata archaeon]|nr:cation:proton antiporter [Thermoplasmata archaeon]